MDSVNFNEYTRSTKVEMVFEMKQTGECENMQIKQKWKYCLHTFHRKRCI